MSPPHAQTPYLLELHVHLKGQAAHVDGLHVVGQALLGLRDEGILVPLELVAVPAGLGAQGQLVAHKNAPARGRERRGGWARGPVPAIDPRSRGHQPKAAHLCVRRVGVSLSIEVVDPLFPPPCEADREPPPPSSEMEPPNSPEARACRLVKDLRENCMAPSVGHRVPGAGLTSQTSRSACESRNQYMPGVSTDLCPPRAQRSGLDGGGPIAPTPSPPSGPRVISWRDPSRPVHCPVKTLPMFRDVLPKEGRMTMTSI